MTPAKAAAGTAWADLVRTLVQAGAVPEGWARPLSAVPRYQFLPDVMWPQDPVTGENVVADRRRKADGWMRWACSDAPITTQWDDGEHRGTAPGHLPTSSSSMPSMVMAMLGSLSVADGMKILEVGTGTGWSAGLLAERLGDRQVVSVEVDAQVAQAARDCLAAAGRHPTVVTADGEMGWAAAAPYDRIIATVAARAIPPAWLAQLSPGGVLVVPWGTHFGRQDALARLVTNGDGTAAGRFTGPASFMQLRAQRLPWPTHGDYVPADWPGDAQRSTTGLARVALFGGQYSTAEFAVGLRVPDCAYTIASGGADGTDVVWLYGLTDQSWAAVFYCVDGCSEFEVYQSGPRRLWHEVEAAFDWWERIGRPDHAEFGLTVTPDAHQIWLHTPEHPVRALPRQDGLVDSGVPVADS